MADNFESNAGSGGQTFASDDIGGIQFPRSKLVHGANGTNDGDVSKANPLPVGTNTVKDGTGTNQAFLADSDGHLQIDVVGALPAGTNAIGKLAANSGVDIGDVDILSIAAGDNNIGNVDIVTVPADPFGANADAASATGSISAKLRFIASTGIPITGTVTVGSHAVTNAGTFAVQVDGTALTRLTDIETNTDSGAVVGNGAAATAQRVTLANDSTGVLATVTTVTTVSTLTGGGIAHDSADSGNPHKIGAKATAAMTARTLVSADDRTDVFAGIDGVLVTRPHCPLEDQLQDRATNTDGASTAMAGGFAAPGANIRLYLTTLIIANSSASAVTVDIRDGSAGSVLLTVPVPANTGGVVLSLPVPLKFSANTAAAYDSSAAASTLTITMIGFKSKAG